MRLSDLPVAPCLGCFACWTRTPGRCPFEDASQLLARAFIQADLAALYAPLRFGVWGHGLKKVLDRMICLVSPHMLPGRLTRHARRYARYPRLLCVGWLPGPDREAGELFTRLVEHNAYNLHAPAWRAVALTGGAPWAAQRDACRDAARRVLAA